MNKLKGIWDLAVKKLFIVLLILSSGLGVHFLVMTIPGTTNYETRILSNILQGCKSGWFSSNGVCAKYTEQLKKENRDAEGELTNYPCGENNVDCHLKGVKDYLGVFAFILDFILALVAGRMMGLMYRQNRTKEIKFMCWTVFLCWNGGVLFLLYLTHGLLLFPGDFGRQIIEIIGFAVVFKIACIPEGQK